MTGGDIVGAKYTEAQNRAPQKFIKDNYEPVTVRFPKGDREKYKAHAESKGMSLNKLIVELLDKDMAQQ